METEQIIQNIRDKFSSIRHEHKDHVEAFMNKYPSYDSIKRCKIGELPLASQFNTPEELEREVVFPDGDTSVFLRDVPEALHDDFLQCMYGYNPFTGDHGDKVAKEFANMYGSNE